MRRRAASEVYLVFDISRLKTGRKSGCLGVSSADCVDLCFHVRTHIGCDKSVPGTRPPILLSTIVPASGTTTPFHPSNLLIAAVPNEPVDTAPAAAQA